MRSFLPKIILFFYVLLFISSHSPAYGDYSDVSQQAQVSASIGAFYISLSGFIAPNASVVLISNDTALRSAVADSNGYFYITGVLINKGFSSFCLDAIDFKRLGESYTCFQVPPANQNITMNDIFLPPTLGLQRTEVTVGDDATIWGYSMPNALVTVHASDGNKYIVTADSSGFYQLNIKIKAAGKYDLFAEASYQSKQSRLPDRKVTLTVLSGTQNAIKQGKKLANNAGKLLIGSPWAWLFILLALIILIILLLKKLKPEWFTFIDKIAVSFFAALPSHEKTLHHAWFVGY